MSQTEPQDDNPQPGRHGNPEETRAGGPVLVFKPDLRQATRVARLRVYTLIAAAVLTFIALLMVVSFQPPRVARIELGSPPRFGSAADSASGPGSLDASPAVSSRKVRVVEAAQDVVASIGAAVNGAAEKWVRASELSLHGAMTRDRAEEAAARLRRAVILADSAHAEVAAARQQLGFLLKASREEKAGTAFRLGVLYSALDRYAKSICDDAQDRLLHYQKLEAAARAALLGDEAESEIQQNVAVSYLRRSEDRQVGIKRLLRQVREALSNIENADR